MRVRTGGDWIDSGPANGMAGPSRVDRRRDDDDRPSSVRVRGELVTAPPATGKNDALTPTQRSGDARPVESGRPRLPVYGSDAERTEARRRSWRESAKRGRERTRVQNHAPSGKITDTGVSGNHDSATMRDGADSGAYSTCFRAVSFSPGVRR